MRSAAELGLLAFERHYEAIAKPFEWKFMRADMEALLAKANRPDEAAYHRAA